jgi:hypothetical protein
MRPFAGTTRRGKRRNDKIDIGGWLLERNGQVFCHK